MKHLLACVLAFLAAAPALAQDDSAERERIRSERAAADARLEAEQKACYGKFAVNDCLDKAKRAHGNTVSELRRQERVLNDAERKRRAADKQRELDERQSPERQKEAAERRARALAEQKERDERAAEKAARRAETETERARRPPREKEAKGAPQPQGSARATQAPKSNAPTAEEAAKNRAAFEKRQEEAARHKAEVAARAARRARPPASDLPAPK